jgi:hypothetical protein
MGIIDSETINKEKIILQLKRELNDLQQIIKNYISDAYNKKQKIEYIIYYIDTAFQKKIFDIDKILNSKKININSINIEESQNEIYNKNMQIKNSFLEKDEIKKYDYFVRKDIQIKNLDITRDFEENIYSDYINDKDVNENESIAYFLYDIANISRLALNESNKFLEALYHKYKEKNKKIINKEDIVITTLDQFKKEFSSWVKANSNFTNTFLADYLSKIDLLVIKNTQQKETKKYFKKLYRDLITLYFQCELSIPTVEVSFDFDSTNAFNSKKMIDIVNNGSERKVNFIFFPSLYSNGNYIDNGKQWVFTYINNTKKQTFFFDKKELELLCPINKNKFTIPKLSDKLKLTIKPAYYLVPKLNYNISDQIKKEFRFYLKKKNDNKIICIPVENENLEIDENLEFIKCEFFLMGEKILSVENLV